MGVLALACLVLGLVPSVALPLTSHAIAAWNLDPAGSPPPLSELVPFASISRAGFALVALAALVAALVRRLPTAPLTVVTWDCGYAEPTPRMQYVDASFSEMLVGLFDRVLRTRRIRPDLVGLLRRAPRMNGPTPFDRIVQPVFFAFERGLRAFVRFIASVHVYLLYVFVIVVLLLMVVR